MRLRRLLWLALLSAPLLGLAQSYRVDWFTIDGGGGLSSNGQYTLHSTIGQPDASTLMSGGTFTVAGGFWSFVAAVQAPGGPLLTVAISNSNVVISWPAPADGWQLRFTAALTNNTVWSGISPPYPTNSLTNVWHSEPLQPGSRFFQLYKP